MTFWASVCAGTLETAIVVSTFIPGAPFVPLDVVLAVVGVTGLAFIAMVSDFGWQDVTSLWVPGVVALVIVIPPLSFGVALTGFSALPGQPLMRHGRYYFNNHGQLLPTTRAGYEQGVASTQRLFAGIAITLSAATALGSAAIFFSGSARP